MYICRSKEHFNGVTFSMYENNPLPVKLCYCEMSNGLRKQEFHKNKSRDQQQLHDKCIDDQCLSATFITKFLSFIKTKIEACSYLL